MILLLAACAWGPARVLADAEHADAFALQAHDTYPFFDALGDLVRTGPTGTNVGDLQLFVARPTWPPSRNASAPPP